MPPRRSRSLKICTAGSAVRGGSAEHLLALAKGATVERRAAGDVVFADGDPGDALYFVIEGSVRV